MFPSNLGKALECYKAVDPLTLSPETLLTFNELEASLLDSGAATRADWRKEVKRVEWMQSYPQNENNVRHLHGLVESLGYVGIVSLWQGDAATGLATVWFKDDRICVRGPQNKAARIALKHITGWKFHHTVVADEKPYWSVPCEMSAAFFNAICHHYPHNDGLAAAVKAAELRTAERAAERLAKELAEAKAAQEALAKVITLDPVTPAPVVAPVVQAPALPSIQVIEAGAILKVRTPYNKEFIAAIKTIPYNSRQWNKIEKVWEVAVNYRAQLTQILAQCFPTPA
jgi:hypothetical protein